MDKNLEPYYFRVTDDDIEFRGDTPEMKELNKDLFHTTLELNRYQDMTKELLEFCEERLKEEKPISPNEIKELVREWSC